MFPRRRPPLHRQSHTDLQSAFQEQFCRVYYQDGDDFLLEFDEGEHERSGSRDRYNGVIVGEHASMLLNWPGDEQSGILTAADYPCRASIPQKSCSRSPPSRKARRRKLTSPKRMNPGLRTGRKPMAEVGAIVEQRRPQNRQSGHGNDRSAVTSGQTSSALSPNAVENAASLKLQIPT